MLTMNQPLLDTVGERSASKIGCASIHKHKIRAAFRVTSFLALIVLFSVVSFFNDDNSNPHRRLDDAEPESNWKGIFQIKADPMWLLAPYILGVVYMFLALAIVCDEYFVPALECMSGPLHLNLTPDISGATLMAAGGSAPELFTSFIGTFQESEVGFGTIVGSAVFNVLFVIGMCSLLSKELLELTWWPLFRDSTYYAIGLLVLAIFVGVKGPGEIDMLEALILLLMYLGYIVIMYFNEKIYKKITGLDLYPAIDETEIQNTLSISFQRPTTFRAGLLTMIRSPNLWIDKARISFVSKVSGNVDDVFDFVDEDKDGFVSRDELKRAFGRIEEKHGSADDEESIDDEEIDKIMADIDTNSNGEVSFVLSHLKLSFPNFSNLNFFHFFSQLTSRSQRRNSEHGISSLRSTSNLKSNRYSINMMLTIPEESDHMNSRKCLRRLNLECHHLTTLLHEIFASRTV
jgi:Ca2+/Na+ antiporter